MRLLSILIAALLLPVAALAQVPISKLPAASTPLGSAPLVPIVQAGVTSKATLGQIFTSPTIATPIILTPTVTGGTFGSSPTLVTPSLQNPHVTVGNLFTDGHAIVWGTGGNLVVAPGNPNFCISNLCGGGLLVHTVTGDYQTVAYQMYPTPGLKPSWGPLVELVVGGTADQTTNFRRWSYTAMSPFSDPGHGDPADDFQIQQETGGTEAIRDMRFYSSHNDTSLLYEFLDMQGSNTKPGDLGIFRRFALTTGDLYAVNIGQTTNNVTPVLTSAGQQDSPKLNLFGAAYDTALHFANWRQWVDVTSNAGASTYKLQTQIKADSSGNGGSWSDVVSFSSSGAITALNLIATNYIKSGTTTVASLPSCPAVGGGARDFVIDATATTFLSTVVGSGSNKVPVVCDGTSWLIG